MTDQNTNAGPGYGMFSQIDEDVPEIQPEEARALAELSARPAPIPVPAVAAAIAGTPLPMPHAEAPAAPAPAPNTHTPRVYVSFVYDTKKGKERHDRMWIDGFFDLRSVEVVIRVEQIIAAQKGVENVRILNWRGLEA